EVVAPLGDAVRLVDREQAQSAPGAKYVEQRQERFGEEALGRYVQEVQAAIDRVALDGVGLGRLERAVQELRTDAENLQGRHLVLHPCDVWADRDGKERYAQRPNMKDHRLASARRHEAQDAVAGLHAVANGRRMAREAVEAEKRVQHVERARATPLQGMSCP